MTFSQTFKDYRKKRGCTQEELAKILMVTPQAVSKWETGAGTPDISLLVPIAEVFGVSVDELLNNPNRRGEQEIQAEIWEIESERLNTGKTTREAYQDYLDLLQSNPKSSRILLEVIRSIFALLSRESEISAEEKRTLYEKAEFYYKQLRESDCQTRDIVISGAVMGKIHSLMGDQDKAEIEFDALPRGYYSAHRMRGMAEMDNKEYEKSKVSYQRSVWGGLAHLLQDIGELAVLAYKTESRAKMDEIYRLQYEIIRVLYKDEPFPIPVHRVYQNALRRLAQAAISKGDIDQTYRLLDDFMSALRAQRAEHNLKTTTNCILFPDATVIDFPYPAPRKETFSGREKALATFAWSAFDRLREDERFQAYIKEVESWD